MWKFAAVSLSHFSSHTPYNYAAALELLQLHTVQLTRHHCDAPFIHVSPVNKFCPSRIDNSSLQVPSSILEISPSFLQDITIALPLVAVSLVCSDTDILSKLKDNVGKRLCRELNTIYMDAK